ncbi:DNA-binding response regulator [Rheinheimera mesophila]|uniref:DNA-binding response regulator n=1 Tax=Rheinheimera mesophila TaxID=1547515 RepID=A0A3P3QGY4_9GAMM|nr:LytTR family DNA-binding domain-containing protein [Rheinheimera mesophila]KKL01803.1 LytTR family transcriptional regulator [Rheinheimera mesophila]RRJ20404.1 DNA-binding response regulator [Rheinheimera mesophila]
MKVLIIEDEVLAAEKLAAYLKRYQPDAELVAQLSSVAQVIEFFSADPKAQQLDLIFSDVELTDGQVFTALEQLELPCPVLFTTAYDQYWMQVFQYQAVDYLLKPFSYPRFAEAMLNFAQLKHKLQQPVTAATLAYKKRFLLRKGQSLSILPVADILLIRAANGVLLATDKHNSVHILTEANLGDIENQLDPSEFFRLNRSDIIHISSILQVEPYNKESVAVVLSCDKEPAISSKTRTALFRKWLNQ